MTKIKVMVVDDSAIVRELLSTELNRQSDIEVVATATDPFVARDKLARIQVDMLVLDIEMPRMDGLTFLKYLMKYNPLPVIVLSSLLEEGNAASLTALELGALEVIPKPGGPFSVMEVISRLTDCIRNAQHLDFDHVKAQAKLVREMSGNDKNVVNKKVLANIKTTNKLLCIGASTGGTQALEFLFKSYDRILPPTLVVIHMPERFTYAYAKRLNDICMPQIKEAEEGEPIVPGYVYIAPGNFHMTVRSMGAQYRVKLHESPKMHGQRPAVDPLFESAAKVAGKNSCGVLLTGMGKDGAQGLLAMKQEGAYTICQDEATSVVFGMPKAGIDLGAAQEVLALNKVYSRLLSIPGWEKDIQ